MKKIISILTTVLIFSGCSNEHELNMDRAAIFYERGEYENAVLEYISVINHYTTDVSSLDEDTIHMLANAHHNLAVIHFKRAYETQDPIEISSFLEKANTEAKRAYDLYPMDVYKNTLDSIRREMNL